MINLIWTSYLVSIGNKNLVKDLGFASVYGSRSYAEDVTSVTSGASQGPHSFNLVFVCLFVCVTAGAIPYLSRICPVSVTTKALQDCT